MYNAKRNREWLLDQLGRECVECSSVEHLELDHVDCFTRTSRKDTHYQSRVKAVAALPFLQVLCRDCHHVKSNRDRWLKAGQREAWEHGTLTGYYARKCKCDPCRDAMRGYEAAKRAAARA